MTQKDFKQTKEWLEKVTCFTFNDETCDGEKEAMFYESEYGDESFAVFQKTIPDTDTNISLTIGTTYCKLQVIPANSCPIDVYMTDSRNTNLCLELFDYVYYHN